MSVSSTSVSTASPVRRSPSPKGVVLGSSRSWPKTTRLCQTTATRALALIGVGVGVSAPHTWGGFGSPRAVNGTSPWGAPCQSGRAIIRAFALDWAQGVIVTVAAVFFGY
ncbi:hypothetical protein BGW80DRAFT_1286033, partial [Lactifluus volemus]